MIVIVDYGVGNTGSLLNMFRRLGKMAKLSNSPEEISTASHLVLPGVGAYDHAVKRLDSYDGLREALHDAVVDRGHPILGVCLGMQLLVKSSAEGEGEGLGWIEGDAVRFDSAHGMRVPHMGWNTVNRTASSPLVDGLPDDSRFYFVHSYHVELVNRQDELLSTDYGVQFSSAICRDNIMGVQFHPEKSHRYGLALLRNFTELC